LLARRTVILGSRYRKAWLLDDLFSGIDTDRISAVTASSHEAINGLYIAGKDDGTMEAAVGRK
ncbi:MAG: hypothetical protein DRJ14_05115, partial [Acidobacteria bacterium]